MRFCSFLLPCVIFYCDLLFVVLLLTVQNEINFNNQYIHPNVFCTAVSYKSLKSIGKKDFRKEAAPSRKKQQLEKRLVRKSANREEKKKNTQPDIHKNKK